jgi:hypothetical protein
VLQQAATSDGRSVRADVHTAAHFGEIERTKGLQMRISGDGPGRTRTCDLGIKSGCRALLSARNSWANRFVEPSQIESVGVLWRRIVDLLLTSTLTKETTQSATGSLDSREPGPAGARESCDGAQGGDRRAAPGSQLWDSGSYRFEPRLRISRRSFRFGTADAKTAGHSGCRPHATLFSLVCVDIDTMWAKEETGRQRQDHAAAAEALSLSSPTSLRRPKC